MHVRVCLTKRPDFRKRLGSFSSRWFCLSLWEEVGLHMLGGGHGWMEAPIVVYPESFHCFRVSKMYLVDSTVIHPDWPAWVGYRLHCISATPGSTVTGLARPEVLEWGIYSRRGTCVCKGTVAQSSRQTVTVVYLCYHISPNKCPDFQK